MCLVTITRALAAGVRAGLFGGRIARAPHAVLAELRPLFHDWRDMANEDAGTRV
jgi:hypothetical protein